MLAIGLGGGPSTLAADAPYCTPHPEAVACSIDTSQFRIDRSLVVNDLSIITPSRFSFAKTIGAILATYGIEDKPANREALVKTLLASFSETEQINPSSNLRIRLDVRRAEQKITAGELLDTSTGMVPVAVFNRFDLAPDDWGNCGEYRIVYAKGGDRPISFIFEAALANANRKLGGRGCKPVADFWLSLSSRTNDEVAAELERFFYIGLGAGFGPAVSAMNFGIPDGQIRSNSNNEGQWQLREWKASPYGAAGISFVPTTTKMSPLAELYGDNSTGALDPNLQELVREQFHDSFTRQYVTELIAPDFCLEPVDANDPEAVTRYRREILNSFGAQINDRYNDFQSTIHFSDSPFNYLGELNAAIDLKISSLPLDLNRRVSREEVVRRAEALTCAGCHGSSNSKVIGRLNSQTEIRFPPPHPENNQHVDDKGRLSAGLKDVFLPFRRDRMIEFLCNPPAVQSFESADDQIAAVNKEFSDLLDALRRGETGKDTTTRYGALLHLLNSIEARKKGYFVQIRRPH